MDRLLPLLIAKTLKLQPVLLGEVSILVTQALKKLGN